MVFLDYHKYNKQQRDTEDEHIFLVNNKLINIEKMVSAALLATYSIKELRKLSIDAAAALKLFDLKVRPHSLRLREFLRGQTSE